MLVKANFLQNNVRLTLHYSTKSVMRLIQLVGFCAHVFRLPAAEPSVLEIILVIDILYFM